MREAEMSCIPISNKSSSKPVFVSGLQAKPSPYLTGHLFYCRLKKSTWAKNSTRANTGCFQAHFQGSWGPPKRSKMCHRSSERCRSCWWFFSPHYQSHHSIQEALDLDYTKQGLAQKSPVFFFSFYPPRHNPSPQPQAYRCRHAVTGNSQ